MPIRFDPREGSRRRRPRITYDGQRWFAGGAPIASSDAGLTQIGTYDGFPVYRRGDDTSRIYIPGADGLVAPFSMRR